MFGGPLALLARSLRIDARSRSTHLIRLALIALAYFNFVTTASSARYISAPGLSFFSSLAYLDIFFIALFGVGYFSTAITEEKEENTLGLMLMAGISPIGILTGKTGARFFQAASLLLIQFPLMLLCVTLGGITTNQIWAATISLLSFLIFVAGFGLFSSTVSKNSRSAGFFVFLGLICYFTLIPLAWESWVTPSSNLSSNWYASDHLSVVYRVNQILQSSFSGSASCIQVYFDAGAGLIFCLLSWLLFGASANDLSSESESRGIVGRRRGFLRFPPGSIWDNPFAWKDFYFVSGGVPMILIRTLFYVGTGIAIGLMFTSSSHGNDLRPVLYAYLFICTLLWPLDLAINVSRSMEQEVRLQTLSSLVMLPHDLNVIVYSKLAGAAIGSLPGLCVIGLLSFASILTSSDLPGPDFGIALFTMIDYALFLLLVPTYAATLGLYLRWGSVAATIALVLITYIVLLTCGGMMGASNAPPFFILFVMACGVLPLHAFCHQQLLHRFRELAEK